MGAGDEQARVAAVGLLRVVVEAAVIWVIMVGLAVLLTGVGFGLAAVGGVLAVSVVVVLPRLLGRWSAWSQWRHLKKRLTAGEGDPRDLTLFLQRAHPGLFPDPAAALVKQTYGSARVVNGFTVTLSGEYEAGLVGRLLVGGVSPWLVWMGMRAGLTGSEMAGHFDGTAPLDWEHVEFLAALRDGESATA